MSPEHLALVMFVGVLVMVIVGALLSTVSIGSDLVARERPTFVPFGRAATYGCDPWLGLPCLRGAFGGRDIATGCASSVGATPQLSRPDSASRRNQDSTNHSHPRRSLTSLGRCPISRSIWLLNENPSGYPCSNATEDTVASVFWRRIATRSKRPICSQ